MLNAHLFQVAWKSFLFGNVSFLSLPHTLNSPVANELTALPHTHCNPGSQKATMFKSIPTENNCYNIFIFFGACVAGQSLAATPSHLLLQTITPDSCTESTIPHLNCQDPI